MISREELIHSKEYWLAQVQATLYVEVENYLRENKLGRTAFAAQLGVSKGYISQLLNADFDHKISKLITLSLAMGKAPVLAFKSLDKLDSGIKSQAPVVEKVLYKRTPGAPAFNESEAKYTRRSAKKELKK